MQLSPPNFPIKKKVISNLTSTPILPVITL